MADQTAFNIQSNEPATSRIFQHFYGDSDF